jgi:hypothetical protein
MSSIKLTVEMSSNPKIQGCLNRLETILQEEIDASTIHDTNITNGKRIPAPRSVSWV